MAPRSLSPAWPLLCGLCLAACGAPLFDDQYRGTPVASLSGQVAWESSEPLAVHDLRLALFFNAGLPTDNDPERWSELRASTHPLATLPAPFTLNLFAWPDEALLVHGEDGRAAGYGIGRLAVYRDSNGDGSRDPGESIVGIPNGAAYLYVPAALPADQAPTSAGLEAGFYPILLPQRCGLTPPPPTDPGDCGVPLGASCNSDAPCNGGTCLKETYLPWPGGACVILDSDSARCRPSRAAYLPAPRTGAPSRGGRGIYARSCASDNDCRRPGEPLLYRCDRGLRACLPMPPLKIGVGSLTPGATGPDAPLEPFCPTPR